MKTLLNYGACCRHLVGRITGLPARRRQHVRSILLSLALLAGPLAVAPVLLITTGCSTAQKTTAYKTLRSTAEAVDAAMRVYAEAVVKGRISDGDIARVKSLHAQYQAGMAQAIAVVRYDYANPTPDTLAGLAANLVETITALTR